MNYPAPNTESIEVDFDGCTKSLGRMMDEPTEEEEDRMDRQSDCYVSRGKWVSR